MGPGGGEGRDRQSKQKLGGGVGGVGRWLSLGSPDEQRNRISEGKVSRLPLPQLSPKCLTAP